MSKDEESEDNERPHSTAADAKLVNLLNKAAEASKNACVTVLIRSDGPVPDHRLDHATLRMNPKFRSKFVPDPDLWEWAGKFFNWLGNLFTVKRLVSVRFDVCESRDDTRAQLTDMLMQWNIRLDSYMRPRMAASRVLVTAVGTLFALIVLLNRNIMPWVKDGKLPEFLQKVSFLDWLQRGPSIAYFVAALLIFAGFYFWFDYKSRFLLCRAKRLTNTDVFLDFIADEFSRRARRGYPSIFFGYIFDYLRVLLLTPVYPFFLIGAFFLRYRQRAIELYKHLGWWALDAIILGTFLFGSNMVNLNADRLPWFAARESSSASIWSGIVLSSFVYLSVQTILEFLRLIFWERDRPRHHQALLGFLWLFVALLLFVVATLQWRRELLNRFSIDFENWPLSEKDVIVILFVLISAGLAGIRRIAQNEKHVMILFNDAQRLGPVFSRLMDQIKGKVRCNLIMVAVWNEEECPTGVPMVGHSMLLEPESGKAIRPLLKRMLKNRVRFTSTELGELADRIQKGADS